MRTLCTLRADLSALRGSLKPKRGPHGKYYDAEIRIAIKFGGTQLQARFQWEEDVRISPLESRKMLIVKL